jgi:integrase
VVPGEIEVRSNPRKTFDLAAAMAANKEQPAAAEMTVSDLVRAYSAARCDGSDSRLKKWCDTFGSISAWELTSGQLQEAARAMLASGQFKPSAINRDLSALGSAYRWIRDKGNAPRGFKSPTLGVSRFEEAIRRVHVAPEQIEKLRAVSFAARDRRFAVYVSLLIDTGARKSELLERRWSEVDLDRREILAPMTKNGTPRVLFFTPGTADLIRRRCPRRHDDALVFEGNTPGCPIDFRKAWMLATQAIGEPDLRMHDVRHLVAARLLRTGTTLAVAAQVMGHDPAVLARRYGHLETAALRTAQEQSWRESR